MPESALILVTAAPLVLGVGLLAGATVVLDRLCAAGLGIGGVGLVLLAPLIYVLAAGPASPESFSSTVQSVTYLGLDSLALLAAFLCLLSSALRRQWRAYRLPLGAIPATRTKSTSVLSRRDLKRLNSTEEMYRYLELATRNSQITVYLQDANLEYIWIVNPRVEYLPSNAIGRTDYEVLPEEIQTVVIGHKTRALSTRTAQTFEIEVASKDERLWFRVDVVPVGEGKEPKGIVCAAIDITRAKRLDMMRTDLSRRLAETLQRFNLALRSERIVVFSQDLEMRYTWANTDETQIGSVIGRTDEEVIPPADRPAIAELKHRAIETKSPQSAEIGIGEGAERRWYDLHVEPNIQPDGKVSGITCASIDVTHRRRNEEHLRLVMRELTHRTKNLLAVVIAIARQTSTQSESVEEFVPALIGRLRALSAAQDLIVADDWAGVAIDDLVTALLAQHGTARSKLISINGPKVMLSPEAAQNLGLAIHELAFNAARHGALSSPTGRLSVSWSMEEGPEGDMLDIVWVEAGGPVVKGPRRRGFGTMVIERNLARALRAEVDLKFGEAGLCAEIKLPMAELAPNLRTDQIRIAEAAV